MRASFDKLTHSGLASRALREASPLEAWLDGVAARATRNFDLGAEHVWLAWESSGWEPNLDEAGRKAFFLVALASLVTQGRGSTRMPLRGPKGREYLDGLLRSLVEDPAERGAWLDAIEKLEPVFGAPGERKAFLVDGEWLYHQKLHRAETLFAEALAARLADEPRPAFDGAEVKAALDAVLERPALAAAGPVELSHEQRSAVLAAVGGPLSVVSGGPGTGKTSIVVSILRLLARLGLGLEKIALAAPTGKAAQRMGESISRSLASVKAPEPLDLDLERARPQTIHMLLGASADGSRMRHHEGNRLEQEVVIVDEASMIDMHLMEKLVRAVRPGARLVLLGDARQLPSVGAGAVLRDLVPDGPGHPLASYAARLTRNYRMNPDDAAGNAILELAKWISPEAAVPARALGDVLAIRDSVAAIDFVGAEAVFGQGPSLLRAFLERWHSERIASFPHFKDAARKTYQVGAGAFTAAARAELEKLFSHFESSRVLCLTRVYRTGSVAVNAALRAFQLAHLDVSAKHDFAAGEPVLMLANDYEKELWNGDQGLVLWVSEDGERARLCAVFRRADGFVKFPVELLRGQLEHCFAMTVHKGQGSEFDRVGVILPEHDVPLLTREILYTAVTRARRSAVIVGYRERLETGVGRRVERFSGAGERLAARAPRRV
jgi:exodeoxyribonuclease V alpha subunit